LVGGSVTAAAVDQGLFGASKQYSDDREKLSVAKQHSLKNLEKKFQVGIVFFKATPAEGEK